MENYTQKSTIRDWAEGDRPREKLLNKGKAALSDAELIAILIGSGTRNESAVDLSRRILASVNNSLIELSKLTLSELQKFKGIGQAKAISIVAALELGRRRRGAEAGEHKKIVASKTAYEIFYPILSDLSYEQFAMILLNRSNKVIRVVNVSEGGVAGTVVDPKKVFRLAIENNASYIILGHNHPSGNIVPSDQDLQLTKKLKKAGETMDIMVIDHIIVGEEKYFSFADEEKL
jgi:DNA repair protein RadC